MHDVGQKLKQEISNLKRAKQAIGEAQGIMRQAGWCIDDEVTSALESIDGQIEKRRLTLGQLVENEP